MVKQFDINCRSFQILFTKVSLLRGLFHMTRAISGDLMAVTCQYRVVVDIYLIVTVHIDIVVMT